MGNDWDMPQPRLTLLLTLALGAFGVLLMPAAQDFAPNMFAGLKGLHLCAWLAAVFAGVLFLKRISGESTSRNLYIAMGAVLLLSLAIPGGVGQMQHGDKRLLGFAWFCFLLLLLIVCGGYFHVRERQLSWKESILRGPVIILTAPLLLFAAQSREGSRVARGVSILLPFGFVISMTLMVLLAETGYKDATDNACILCMSFCTWAWLGCGLLLVLGRWPEFPRTPAPATGVRKTLSLLTLGVIAAIFLMVLILRQYGFLIILFHPVFIWGGAGCTLALVLIPWPAYPAIPRLGELPETRKIKPETTIVLLAAVFVLLFPLVRYPLMGIISGTLFSEAFNEENVGGGLDQPSLNKAFFLSIVFSAMVFSHVAAAHWMSNRKTRAGYWAFTFCSVVLCVSLNILLIAPTWWSIQYIGAMGWTATRAGSLICTLMGHLTILAFLCWTVWPVRVDAERIECVGQ